MLTKKTLESLEADWEPAKPKQLAKIVAKLKRWPKDLAVLYEFCGGGTVGTVDVFDLEELADVNSKQDYVTEIPGSVFFASDGGDGFFYVDAKGVVHWMDRGASTRRHKAAKDVAAFLRKAEKLAAPWPAPKREKDEDAFQRFLTDHPELFERREIDREHWALGQASSRCNIRIAGELEKLHNVTDGMRIPRAGITLVRASEISPVVETIEGPDQRPSLVWIGEDDRGHRLAYVCPGGCGIRWRGIDDGNIVEVAKGADVIKGKDLGPLDEVVIAWAMGSKSGNGKRHPERRSRRARR